MEIWKAVVGFEGHYEVSDQGRVRSLDRVVSVRRGSHVWGRKVKGRVLAPCPHKGGYALVFLHDAEGQQHVFGIHALVAAAFIGPTPVGQQVCHDDGSKRNNKLSNLRHDTPTGNNRDKLKHGTLLRGDTSPVAKVTATDVAAIRAAAGRETQATTAARFGITFSNVSAIQLRKSWRHV